MTREAEIVYHFNRLTCLGFSVFSAVLVVAFIFLAVLAGDEMFVEGIVPGWLFGTASAVLLSAITVSWVRRLAHSGPALILNDSGVTVHRLSGGPFSPRVARLIRWEEIAAVSVGPHGGVALNLEDPEAWFAQQSFLSRLLAWHPSPHRRGRVTLGGIDLGAGPQDLFLSVQSRVDQARLERRNDERLTSGDGD